MSRPIATEAIWFTDPPAGSTLYEGAPEVAGAPGNLTGRYNSRAGQPLGVGNAETGIPMRTSIASTQSGRVEIMVTAGISGSATASPSRPTTRRCTSSPTAIVLQLRHGRRQQVSNQKQFTNFMVDGVQCRTDGIRVDMYGNLWCGSNAGRNLGYSGVTVWSPEGSCSDASGCRRPAPTWRSVDRNEIGCS